MENVLQTIPPIDTKMKPPIGAVAAGTTPDGRQIYRLVTKRSKSQPKNDEKGDRIWRKHPLTGEPLTALREPVLYDDDALFTMLDQGNGNGEKVPYYPPTEAERAAGERAAKIAAMGGGALGEAMVDAGLSNPAEVINLLKARQAAPFVAPAPMVGGVPVTTTGAVPPVPTAATPAMSADELAKYPVKIGGGWWKFSNGTRAQTSEDAALQTEIDVQAARKTAAEQPEE
jgi:hypothetical protein